MALIFTTHALRRMRLRGILVREVREALRAPVEGHTIVVTAYEPDPEHWEPGFRRGRPVP